MVILLGGSGTIGHELVSLMQANNIPFIAPPHAACDLLVPTSIGRLLEGIKNPEEITLIHLAAVKTNITLNSEIPVDIFTKTVQMGLNVYAAAQRFGVKRVITVASSCCYPTLEIPMTEDMIDSGPVHESIAPHGNGKRFLVNLSKYYRQQYGLNSTVLVMNNIFGGCDFTKPLKFMDSLIAKFTKAVDNNEPTVTCLGSGGVFREVLFYKDAAMALFRVLHSDKKIELMNIGVGIDMTIRMYTELIANIVGFKGEIVWVGGNDGANRKLLDSSYMKRELKWEPPANMPKYIEETIEEFRHGTATNNK